MEYTELPIPRFSKYVVIKETQEIKNIVTGRIMASSIRKQLRRSYQIPYYGTTLIRDDGKRVWHIKGWWMHSANTQSVPPRDENGRVYHCSHLNQKSLDDRYENLAWEPPDINRIRQPNPRLSCRRRPRLGPTKARQIFSLVREGTTQEEASRMYDTTPSGVFHIMKGNHYPAATADLRAQA